MSTLDLTIVERSGRSTPVSIPVDRVLLAGYTGRDQAKVMEHIHELALMGVAPPEHVPMVYVVPGDLATIASAITVNGAETSGEVEFYLVPSPDGLLVGVASDHTDRKEEAVDVAASKALCPKVLSREVWRLADLEDHWDQIEIRSWVTDGSGRRLYQEDRVDAFMPVEAILAEVRKSGHSVEGNIVSGGTLPLLSGFVYGSRFEGELYDPVLARRLTINYEIRRQS